MNHGINSVHFGAYVCCCDASDDNHYFGGSAAVVVCGPLQVRKMQALGLVNARRVAPVRSRGVVPVLTTAARVLS